MDQFDIHRLKLGLEIVTGTQGASRKAIPIDQALIQKRWTQYFLKYSASSVNVVIGFSSSDSCSDIKFKLV